MQPPLNDDIYKRKGISLLWDVNVLASFCDPRKVLSLRSFLGYYKNRWKGVEKEMSKGHALVVAGLESCIDSLQIKEAEDLLSDLFYRAIVSFQEVVAGGGSKAALILWIGNHTRVDFSMSGKLYLHANIPYNSQKIALGQCIFKGSEGDIREIESIKNNQNSIIGLFQDRIS